MRIPKTILLICLLFFGFKALPQNNISVHHAYGKAEVVIPIFNLEVDDLKLPIYLEYDATCQNWQINYSQNTAPYYKLGDTVVSGEVSSRLVRASQERSSGTGFPEL